MHFNKANIHKIILLTIFAVMAVMAVLMFVNPPFSIPDPNSGFEVMRSMQHGSGFNILITVNPDDLSKNKSEFLTWWSPGQYLAPYLLSLLFRINVGNASSIITIVSNLLAVTGFYYFFKELGFNKPTASVSILFIVCQQIFWIPYTSYNGGETLLFGFEGWFLYGCAALKKPDLTLFIFVLLSGWIGFMCKLSFIWIYGAGLLCLWIRLSAAETKLVGWIKKGVWVAIPAIICLVVLYIFFLSKGENPSTPTAAFKPTIQAIGFPLAQPILTGFSVDDLLNGLLNPDGKPIFTTTQTILLLILFAIISVLLIWAILHYVPGTTYKVFIIVFYCVSVVFFVYAYSRQAVISYEARHFRLIGLLIAPGVVYGVSRFKFGWRLAFLLICMVLTAQSIQYTKELYKINLNTVRGASGFSLPTIDRPSLNYITMLDKQSTNAIFALLTGDVALEIQHNRILILDEYDKNTERNMTPYNGHAGPVYMLLPAAYANNAVTTMFKYFPGYKNFVATPLSKNLVLYSAH